MRPQLFVSLANFFSATHYFLIIFIIAPYLATLMPESFVGLVISLGAFLTLLAFPFTPKLVRRYGARKLALVLGVMQFGALLALALSPSALAAILLVALVAAISPLMAYQLDLLLESTIQDESETARVRSIFITVASVALIGAPLAVGLLLGHSEAYARVFLAAALSLLPFMFLLLKKNELPQVKRDRKSVV